MDFVCFELRIVEFRRLFSIFSIFFLLVSSTQKQILLTLLILYCPTGFA